MSNAWLRDWNRINYIYKMEPKFITFININFKLFINIKFNFSHYLVINRKDVNANMIFLIENATISFHTWV